MKNLLKNPIFYVCSWFVCVSVFALLVSSCATHRGCDAYSKAKSTTNTGISFEIMTQERAAFMLTEDDER